MPVDAAWVAAAAAIAAAVIGPAASVYVARRQARSSEMIARAQLNATLVSASRQAWINKLRDAIAEFQASMHNIGFRTGVAMGVATEEERVQRALHLRAQCALLINPAESDHRELLALMDQALSDAYASGRQGAQKLAHTQQQLTAVAQRLLKREWERVKQGEQGQLLPSTTEPVSVSVRDA